jgi:hypothetical protein
MKTRTILTTLILLFASFGVKAQATPSGSWSEFRNTSWTSGTISSAADLSSATLMEMNSTSNFEASTGMLTLNFSEATSISAGKPYIIKWDSGSNVVNPAKGIYVNNGKKIVVK